MASTSTVTAANAGLAKTPTLYVAKAAKADAGYKFTVVVEVQDAASGTAGDFYTKGGLLYSQVLATFDQTTESALVGIANKYETAQTSAIVSAKPLIPAGQITAV
jgi:hypothetical protein